MAAADFRSMALSLRARRNTLTQDARLFVWEAEKLLRSPRRQGLRMLALANVRGLLEARFGWGSTRGRGVLRAFGNPVIEVRTERRWTARGRLRSSLPFQGRWAIWIRALRDGSASGWGDYRGDTAW